MPNKGMTIKQMLPLLKIEYLTQVQSKGLVSFFLFSFFLVFISSLTLPAVNKEGLVSWFWFFNLITMNHIIGNQKNKHSELLFYKNMVRYDYYFITKVIINFFIATLNTFIILFGLVFFFSFKVQISELLVILMGNASLISIITLSIFFVSKSNFKEGLQAILSLPLLLPQLLLCINVHKKMMFDAPLNLYQTEVLLIFFYCIFSLLLSLIIFYYLWTEL